ncbi:DinB family protein [Pedobacter sp.]|uniref:DinB family protein n=1 Tax=Pedobacter sp. TaxID=1411316 RepID=UPI003D7F50EA
MGNIKEFYSLQRAVEAYRSKLYSLPESQFSQAPPQGGWSASEVYDHIFDASLLSLIALNECLEGRGSNRPTPFVTKLILFFGAFPPGIRFKTPEMLEGRVKVITKAEATALIKQFTEALEATRVKSAKANPKVKSKHPRLGYLNASQWLRFIGIHLRHHLKQLKRVDNQLGYKMN